MNKMMIAVAAAALAGVATAGICDGETPDPIKGAQRVYDFKASVKLVDGKTATAKETTKGSICVGSVTTYNKAFYRVKASRTFKGVFIDCDVCEIDAVRKGEVEAIRNGKAGDWLTTYNQAYFYVSSSDTKYKAIYNAQAYDEDATDQGYKFLLANFIGGATYAKSKVAEALVQLNFAEYDKFGEYRLYSLLAAGFGTRQDSLIKNVSGNLAGAVSAATWCGFFTQCYEPCLETPYYNGYSEEIDPDTMQVTVTYDQTEWQNAPSPAFDAVSGTWSIKYNASKSKYATQDKVLTKTFGSNAWLLTKDEGAETFAFPFNFIELGAAE